MTRQNIFKRLLLFLLMLVCCSPMTVHASTVKINHKSIQLTVGQKKQLKVSGTRKKVHWTSKNKKVVTVSSKGKITAKKKGTTTITAKVKGKRLTCKVTVKSKKKTSTYPGYLSGTDILGCKGGSSTSIKVTTFPFKTEVGYSLNSTTYKHASGVTWSSSDSSILAVSKKGDNTAKVTIKKAGTAKIYAKYKGKTYTFTIKITDPDARYKTIRKSIYTKAGIQSGMKAQYKAFLSAVWICKNVKYSSHGSTRGQTYEEALNEGTAECAGYAKLFKYLMDGLDIPCNTVLANIFTTDDHMYNQVKIDGQYYNVDVSWMDAGDTGVIYMINFLQSTNSRSWKDGIGYNGTSDSVGHGTSTFTTPHAATSTRFDYANMMADKKTVELIQNDLQDGIMQDADQYSPWFTGEWANY